MKKEMYIKYEAPEVEVLEVEVEKGFQNSGFGGGGSSDGEE